MRKTRTIWFATLITALSLLMTGCGPAKPAALGDEDVKALATRMLVALDADDYAAFTSDFSTAMLEAISEAQFADLRAMLQSASGNFVSMGELFLYNNKGYAIYQITCKYEKEDVVVILSFEVDGTQVEGLWFDSPALRAASQ